MAPKHKPRSGGDHPWFFNGPKWSSEVRSKCWCKCWCLKRPNRRSWTGAVLLGLLEEDTLSVLNVFGVRPTSKGMRGEPGKAAKHVGARRYGLWNHNLGDTGSAVAGGCCWWWIRPAENIGWGE